mmetsp:Transcript_98720/g.307568  ORF Transcript_98720/g.307568 Transcript_98720/m.307568 type:complete len:256 (+) Transcript_98720:85-852(+)|eukprot:CAMPEP_0204521300 /NCGR_PEP_ID=MMETSP0661-20131031/5704_1 /ASSEMBLY_ACC=CAM_ASM_000606 /TAXON_ID=109239 /ORGANISM="Alexandrium margalefi, Strain AMGDE01CS-322" /LENGTH=255 /DNA_ID=CAMNT_0051526885 /DNA_START=92 /DNA_END=859 /DNA_ORIENTATION=+
MVRACLAAATCILSSACVGQLVASAGVVAKAEAEDDILSLLQATVNHSEPGLGRKQKLGLETPRQPGDDGGATLKHRIVPLNSERRRNDTDSGQLDFAGYIAMQFTSQLQYEMSLTAETVGPKNKIILAILEMLGLGLCGIDRCYMGQTCIGFVKGFTFGGLVVWAVLDYFSVMVTCLSKSPAINAIGLKASFTKGSVTPAFVLVIVLMVLTMCIGSVAFKRIILGIGPKSARGAEPKGRGEPEGEPEGWVHNAR